MFFSSNCFWVNSHWILIGSPTHSHFILIAFPRCVPMLKMDHTIPIKFIPIFMFHPHFWGMYSPSSSTLASRKVPFCNLQVLHFICLKFGEKVTPIFAPTPLVSRSIRVDFFFYFFLSFWLTRDKTDTES